MNYGMITGLLCIQVNEKRLYMILWMHEVMSLL